MNPTTIKPQLDYTKIHDIELENIDFNDYPDFCDAYIVKAVIEQEDGTYRDATDDEIEEMNDNSSFVHETVFEKLF